jgi:transposase
VIRRHGLSDGEWEFVRPLLPESLRERKRLDDRRVLNGIVWKFRTEVAWRDVPERYGPGATLRTRFRRWAMDGTCDRMLRAAQVRSRCRRRRRLARRGSLDRRTCPPARGRTPKRGPRAPALGRSRVGLTRKIHLACDGRGKSLALVVAGGNTDDCTRFTAVMEAIRVPRRGPGRPGVRPGHVLGDKCYSSKAIRTRLRRRGIPHTIPEQADQVRNRAQRGSRGPAGPRPRDVQAPQRRGTGLQPVERWRGVATTTTRPPSPTK